MTSVVLPVSTAASRKEHALWLLEKMVPGTGVNNLSLAFSTEWRIPPALLDRTLALLLDRHEILRTVFHEQPSGLTRSVAPAGALRVPIDEVNFDGEAADLRAALTEFIGRPFELDGEPLLRGRLFHTRDRDVFCLAVHHLIFDAMSTPVLAAEFSELSIVLHRGEPVPAHLLAPVPAAADIQPTPQSLAFWRRQLRDFENTRFDLCFGTESDDDPLLTGGTVVRQLAPEVQEVIRGLRKRLRAPEAVILLAVYYLLLAQHGAGPDLVVGTPVTSRPPTAPRAIGYHVNVVPLRLRLDAADSVAALVRKCRDVFLDSIAHADVPVDDLLLEVPRSESWRNTLFQHVFNYAKGADASHVERAGLKGLPTESGFAKFDLELFVLPTESGLTVRVVYHTRMFTRAEAELLLGRYEALFLEAAQDVDRAIGQLRGWSQTDHDVITAANRTTNGQHPADVPTAIGRRCRTAPEAVALQDGERAVTYRQLWRAAARVGAELTAAGVEPGDVVAVAAPRSAELAAAVLGVWQAGAAYLPIDPGHPAERIEYVLHDSGARAVLATPQVHLPAGHWTRLPMPPVPDEPGAARAECDISLNLLAECHIPLERADRDCAYLIYTSGSTGRPKGTLLSHGNLANLVEHFRRELSIEAGDGVLWSTTFGFDISALELFLPLVSGGRVVVAPDEARTDGAVLAGLLRRHDVRVVQATPTSWRVVVDDAAAALHGRIVLCGGEGLPAELARRLVHTGARLHNVYGPTETCIWSTAGGVSGAEPVTVGRPIRQTQVFVTAPDGRELPIGVCGELCIAGAGVAIGYHRRPELTADRFGMHATYGRYYRTGDLARWLPDGTVQVLGRSDRQVKLRGNRIELAEVEAALGSHPSVRAAAVVLVGDPTFDGVLVAWVETDASDIVDELWQHARRQLPAASVPQEFLLLPALPTNASQKVDYPRLTRLAAERARESTSGDSTAPDRPRHGDELVNLLIGLWSEVLDRPGVAAETNFFAHGGHSLLGVKLVQRVEQETGMALALADLFSQPTPAGLAVLVAESMSGRQGT
jgi:amino acid adenylation domain-containing protein